VGPGFYFGFSPGEEDVRVMALLFGDGAHFVYKRQRLSEVGELEFAHDVMPFYDFPLRRLFSQIIEVFSG
jgi:hypothetical protein